MFLFSSENPSGSPAVYYCSLAVYYCLNCSLASKPSMSDSSLMESQFVLPMFQLDGTNCAENILYIMFILRGSHPLLPNSH